MAVKSIIKNYEDLKQLPFPRISKNKRLGNWIEELAELDGFYAGIAESLIAGKTVKKINLPDLDHLFKELENLNSEMELNESLLRDCENYLVALDKLAQKIKLSLKKNSKKK